MPGSLTPPGHHGARDLARHGMWPSAVWRASAPRIRSIGAQWLACTFPCRRFDCLLAETAARLGADVVRYSFIAMDLHHLLLAG
jgi:hypothetical protein